jgi:para-nitrobenzyl esterase
MKNCLWSRRSIVGQGLLAAGVAILPRCLSAQQVSAPAIVKTRLGALRGKVGDGVRVFRGLPYAEPPVGQLRFRPAEKKMPWPDVRDANVFQASPIQTGEPGVKHSEDCLYLNLWTPVAGGPQGKGPWPVFVWIHGGGFTGGHAFEPTYDGSQFAREGVVVVTVGYRLGVFGFLDCEPLLGAAYAGTANNALGDLVTALEWLQKSIGDFGGDPARITLGGESAGAKLTDVLLGTPRAHPLFAQAISESGGAERVWSQPDAAHVAEGFGKLWKDETQTPFSSIRDAPASTVLDVQTKFLKSWPQHFPLRPQLDGALLPRLPVESIRKIERGKRLLIGTNRDESALFLGPHPEHDPTAQDIGNLPLPRFDEVFAKYATLYPDMSDELRRIRAVTAEEYWVPSERVAEAFIASGGAAWMYRLDCAPTTGRMKSLAFHSEDVDLVWNHPKAVGGAGQAAMAKQIHNAWLAFLRGEAPAADGLPMWPRYSREARTTMLLDTTSKVAERPNEDELRLWDGVL